MNINDHESVNLSEDNEINHHLQKAGKMESEGNREAVREMANKCKRDLDKTFLTQSELQRYLCTHLELLD